MKERGFQIGFSETKIKYFSPSDNENKMLEDLQKFEDFMFSQNELKPQSEVQKLKLALTSLHFGIFINGISLFSNEEFDSSNDNEIDFEN